VRRILAAGGISAVTYGTSPENDVRVEGVEVRPEESSCVVRWTDAAQELAIPLPGRHHLLNAAAAVTVARHLGVEPAAAAAALRSFRGVRRRYERRGSIGGAAFVDDYAHHPTEIAATLASARASSPAGDGGVRVVAVFQPHRYSRTAAMWRELGRSLMHADVAVVTDVYAAGEWPVPGITGKLVVDALAEASPGKRIVYLPHRADLARFLVREVRAGDLVLTLGAGDVTMVSEEVLARLAPAEHNATEAPGDE
jgi:UDP-N-acetylmuramate--alanine ligase